VKIAADMEEADASTRAGNGVKQSEPTLLGLEVTGLVRTDEGDTNGFAQLETAFLTRAALDLMVLDGPSNLTGSRGYRFDAKVQKFGEDQSLNQVDHREFSLKPCVGVNGAPQKVVVTAGVPVFTALG
jgi:hypothetical protein